MEIFSYFKEKRGYGLHEGIDILGNKKEPVKSLLQGTVARTGIDYTGYGNFIVMKHNTKYFFKEIPFMEDFYTLYGHFRSINPIIYEKAKEKKITKRFVNIKDELGYFGNTGSCWTTYNKDGTKSDKSRPVTMIEQSDVDCNFGVHLHFSIFSEKKEGNLKDWLLEKKILNPSDVLYWNFRYYYNPEKLLDFFKVEFGE